MGTYGIKPAYLAYLTGLKKSADEKLARLPEGLQTQAGKALKREVFRGRHKFTNCRSGKGEAPPKTKFSWNEAGRRSSAAAPMTQEQGPSPNVNVRSPPSDLGFGAK